ncbi:S1 family peptidase [Nocardiopsis coralliicola]
MRRIGAGVAAVLGLAVAAYACGIAWEYTRGQPPAKPTAGPAATADHPWLVAVSYPQARRGTPSEKGCVGTLVHPQAVVTAGHCIAVREPDEVAVVAGRTDLRTGEGRTVAAAELWTAPGFAGFEPPFALAGLATAVETAPDDIGVVVLDEPLDAEPLPMAAAGAPVPEGEIGQLLGWRISPQDDPVLWQTSATLLSERECVRRAADSVRFVLPALHGTRYAAGAYLCAGADGDAVPVRATDSGSPLVVDGALAGVAAWSPSAHPGSPDYFTRVSAFAGEVDRVIAGALPLRSG